MAGDKADSGTKTPPGRRSWANTNSRQVLKAYDKSPLASPTHSPPMSRNNSTTSINSTQSEPSWNSRRHQSEPFLYSNAKPRQDSTASKSSAKTTDSHKKSGFKSFFGHKDPAEKERKKQQTEKIVLGSRYAAAAKTKMMMDPKYRELREKHEENHAKTAGINEHIRSAHSKAAELEARHPHSGPPALHGSLDLPMLSRIESHDEEDTEIDQWEARRREWNDAKEHNLVEIPEIRSRQGSARQSPWVSPSVSRDPSPDRDDGAVRPALGSKRNSWAGGFARDDSGRWRKTPPNMTPVLPTPGDMRPDLLAQSLAERLNTTA